MASVNKVILVGNLGADPELRYLPSGDAVCSFRLATTDKYKDKTSGEQKEITEWHRCTAFARQAEICGEYLKKGASVYIEGKIQTKTYEKDGKTHYQTEIRIHVMQMMGGRGAGGGGQQEEDRDQRNDGYGTSNGGQGRSNRTGGHPASPAGARAPALDEMSDDIPF